MSSSVARTWCPALNAQPESLESTVSPRKPNRPAKLLNPIDVGSPRPQRAGSPDAADTTSPAKGKGGNAADESTSTTQTSVNLVNRVHSSQVFSARVAQSQLASQRAAATAPLAEKDQPKSGPSLLGLARPGATVVDVRSLSSATSALENEPVTGKKVAIRCTNAKISTANLIAFTTSEAFQQQVDALNISGSLHATNSVLNFAKMMNEVGNDNLVELDLSSNAASLGGAGGDDGNQQACEELGKYFAHSKNLKAVKLNDTNLGPSAFPNLAQAILTNGSIESIEMASNAMGKNDEAAEKLAQLLQEDKFVLYFNADDNDLTGAQVKAIANAIAQSDTRVATPPPEEEPPFEPYTDELPPDEEPPSQPIGFPEDLERKAAEEARAQAIANGEEVPPEEGTTEDAGADDDEKKEEVVAEEAEVVKDEDGGDEEAEEEEEEEVEEKKKPSAEKKKEEEDGDKEEEEEEEVDEEERQAKEAERLAAEKAELEEKAAAYNERHEQYIWGPERAHFEYEENTVRRKLMQEHIDETTALKLEEKDSREASKNLQLKREAEDRQRRSGWTHLRGLSLASNALGSEGAVAIAQMLRHELPLEKTAEDEEPEEEAGAEDGGQDEVEDEELPGADPGNGDDGEADGDDGEGEKADENEEGNGGDETEDAEKEQHADPTASPPKQTAQPKPPKPTTKPGVQTIEFLDLSACSIGPKGVKALCATVGSNAPNLKTLLLRRNKFALKHKELPHPEADEEDDPPKPNLRVPVEDYQSPGVIAIAEMLQINTTLTTLDLSHNGMFPVSIQILAQGLKNNSTLQNLHLDGNNIGGRLAAVASGTNTADGSAFTALFGAVKTMQGLHTLTLSATQIGEWIRNGPQSNADAVAALESVRILDLSLNDLRNEGAHKLRVAFSTSSMRLKALHLDNCGIVGAEGGGAIAGWLMATKGLQALTLSENPLGDEGTFAVCNMLCSGVSASSMKTLNFRRVGLSEGQGIRSVLTKLSMLSEIDLGDNAFSAIEAAKMVDILTSSETCPSMRSFSLWSRKTDLAQHLLPILQERLANPTKHSIQFVNIAGPSAEGLNVDDLEEDDDQPLKLPTEAIEASLVKKRLMEARKHLE